MFRRLTIFSGIIAFIFVLMVMVQFWVFLSRPIVVVDSLSFKIKPGQSVRNVLQNLSTDKSIEPFSPLWFEVFIRLHKASHRIQAGEYLFEKGLTGKGFLKKVTEGDVVLHAHTIVEGWTFKNLLLSLQQNPAIIKTITVENAYLLPAKLGTQSLSLEGLFFPETYFFPKGTTDVEFLERAYKLMQTQLQEAWQARADDTLLKTPYEMLILASVIEKESQLAREWPLVSQVFHNRLKKGMRLQADPTVIYGMGLAYQGNLTKQDLKTPTPYNSYVNKGLPPTPIAMPSFGAMLSAARPAPGEYLFFVAKGDGSHHFSSSLKEHQEMVDKYIRGKS